jgi:DUF1009 family protein
LNPSDAGAPAGAPGKLGLIAGNGRFPFLVLESARAQRLEVVVAAIREETFPEIADLGYPVHWLGLGQLGKLVRLFKTAGVTRAVMAGQVKHAQIFGTSLPDLTMIRMLARLERKNTDALIGGVAKVLEKAGITLLPSTQLIAPHLAVEGTLTRRGLDAREAGDVEYGRPLAQTLARLDIGQALVVRDRAVVAVEAMEGTDAVIRRAGEISGKGLLTVIKVSKPKQDMRFDVPVVGAATVRVMAEVGATALVIDSGRTLVIDRTGLLEAADAHGIAVVAFPPAE